MIDLNLLIQQAGEMTPFRASTVRLAQMVTSQNCHLSEVMDLIAYDQVLTMKLMRAANCATQAHLEPVVTPQEAVTRLGTTMVLALAVAAGVRPQMQRRIEAYGLDEGALWRHSVAAAVAAQTSVSFCSVELPTEAFTVALLHDIGKVVMGRFLRPDVLHYIHECQHAEGVSEIDAESRILGVHHGELGGLIAQQWQLSPRIVQGIVYHHNPQLGNDVLCDLACLSSLAATQIVAGLDNRPMEFSVPEDVAARLGTNALLLETFCPIAASRFVQVSQCYNAV